MAAIEYFYSAHSAFAYLGSQRLSQIAQAGDRTILHRPIDLTRVLRATGPSSFSERTVAHRAYYFGREIERWSEYRGAPVMGRRPTHHDNDVSLANCLVIAVCLQGHSADELAHAMLQAHWLDDADLASRSTLTDLVDQCGLKSDALFDVAGSSEVENLYQQYTEEAIARSVFGSPTYFVDGDMFYGQDRLELIERALQKPFAGDWPRV